MTDQQRAARLLKSNLITLNGFGFLSDLFNMQFLNEMILVTEHMVFFFFFCNVSDYR